MTSGPIISSAALTGAKIDVAKVVDQLMEVERQPLVKIDKTISESDVKISTLGQFQAKLSSVKQALDNLQNGDDFIAVVPYVSKNTALSVKVASAATKGQHTVSISQLAEPEIWKVEGFATLQQARDWFNDTDQAAVKASADASVISNPDGTYTLWLTSNGGDLDVSTPGVGLTGSQVQAGQDAIFSVNGYNYTRSSNTISDVLEGVTLELLAPTTGGDDISLRLESAAVSAAPRISAFVDSLNDLQALYQTETASSTDRSARGALNSDLSVMTIIRDVISSVIRPIVSVDGSDLSGQSDITLLGIKLNQSGRFEFSEALLNKSTDVQEKLAAGIQIGYDASQDNNLSDRIGLMIASGGLLFERIDQENESRKSLVEKKIALEDKLVDVELRLRTQYAALDALLFRLNSTSSALKSALDGLSQNLKSD
jgi:flagellar hook-associated protein 2